MSKELFPRREPKDKSYRRWRVDYDLVYDGGGMSWVGYYRTKAEAVWWAWWNKYAFSWGGTAVLTDQQDIRTHSCGDEDCLFPECRTKANGT